MTLTPNQVAEIVAAIHKQQIRRTLREIIKCDQCPLESDCQPEEPRCRQAAERIVIDRQRQ